MNESEDENHLIGNWKRKASWWSSNALSAKHLLEEVLEQIGLGTERMKIDWKKDRKTWDFKVLIDNIRTTDFSTDAPYKVTFGLKYQASKNRKWNIID